MSSDLKNSTLDINPIRPILTSDLYFCKNCNQGWKDNKWMECCKGCVGHRDMGWTIDDMKCVYGTAMDALIGRNQDCSYYFPAVKRELTRGCRRLSFDPNRSHWDKDILQPFVKYELDWRMQQAELLSVFKSFPCKNTWDSLDPEVQRRVVYKYPDYNYNLKL